MFVFFKKMGNTRLSVQKRNVMRTMSDTALYGKICGFMILEW
jgi:hypothetical protein